MLVIHDKTENAAARTAAKTMKRLPLRADGKGRRFLLVEWAKRLVARARSLQWKIRTDYLNDVVRGGNLLDILSRDACPWGVLLFASCRERLDGKLMQRRPPAMATFR